MKPRERIEDKFWRYVRKTDGCWLWTGTKLLGYGRIYVPGTMRTTSAHRLSYEMHKGPIPPGLFVCHSCDTPACVNPDHLWAGTSEENSKDRHAKGRTRVQRGEKQGHARLTEGQVREIRALYAAGGTSYYKLADRFGVHWMTICHIVKRATWKHVA